MRQEFQGRTPPREAARTEPVAPLTLNSAHADGRYFALMSNKDGQSEVAKMAAGRKVLVRKKLKSESSNERFLRANQSEGEDPSSSGAETTPRQAESTGVLETKSRRKKSTHKSPGHDDNRRATTPDDETPYAVSDGEAVLRGSGTFYMKGHPANAVPAPSIQFGNCFVFGIHLCREVAPRTVQRSRRLRKIRLISIISRLNFWFERILPPVIGFVCAALFVGFCAPFLFRNRTNYHYHYYFLFIFSHSDNVSFYSQPCKVIFHLPSQSP